MPTRLSQKLVTRWASLVGLLIFLASQSAWAQQPLPTPDPPESPHAISLRARWVTVPGWSLAPFLDTHTQLNDGWSVGIEYLYRHAGFDVVISVDYSWLNADSGNYLAAGHDPSTDTHLLVFDRLSAISADVSLIGHWNLTSWLEFRFGAGLGVGGVLGNIYQITNNSGCTSGNASDTTNCYPTPIGPVNQLDDTTRQKLTASACAPDLSDNGMDTTAHPCYRRIDTYPLSVRVVPVLNVLLGLRFRMQRHLYLHLDGGWRLVGFYAGGGPEFRF